MVGGRGGCVKLLFIDHECHRKTQSTDFLIDILRRSFEVTVHSYSNYYQTGSEAVMPTQDIAVVLEFPVSRRQFFFPGKRNVFVPMYDNEWASYWQWKRIAWSGMGVISFCEAVTRHARRCGVRNILELKYFPPLEGLPHEPGDPKRVFLWERGDISRQVAEILFPPSEGYVFDVKGAKEFLPREEYLQRLAKCGIVIAPRRKEGIGMAFLEAMAMGKCVAAHSENKYLATMFQAIRIEVNSEMEVLREFLGATAGAIKEGGRLVVMTYHSLEDRPVKNFMKAGNFDGSEQKDIYGNVIAPFQMLTRKVITPSGEEMEQNPRSRSAKLRIAQRTEFAF